MAYKPNFTSMYGYPGQDAKCPRASRISDNNKVYCNYPDLDSEKPKGHSVGLLECSEKICPFLKKPH